MTKRLRALLERREKTLAAAKKITDGLRDSAPMTAAETEEFDTLMARVNSLDEDIERAEAAAAEPLDQISALDGISTSFAGSPFNDTRDYLQSVMRAGHPSIKAVDDRLLIAAAATTYGNEGVGEDGGYLVPTGLANTINQYSLESSALIDFCNTTPVGGNLMTFPVSESTPWGSSGIQTYWEGEAAEIEQSKPKFEARELRLRKLTALVPVTNELLEDAVALAAWLPRELGNAARWKTNDAIINGSGAGIPQGFTQSGALITQAKEASQTADTIVAQNIAKMYARCTNPNTAVWIVNPDSFPQLPLLTIGNQPVWTPVNEGMKSSPGGMLLGRPVVMSDACQTLGDAGDIYFSDLQSYAVIQKRQGPRIAMSMHLWFDYDLTAFRLTLRIDGQSLFRTAVTPPNSAVTRSPFVRLAARA